METEQTRVLSLRAAYLFGAQHRLQKEVDEIRNMVIEWDSSYTSSLRRGYIVDLFQRRGVFDEFKAQHWVFGNTGTGETLRRRYLQIKARYEDYLAGQGEAQDEAPQLDDEVDGDEFANESDLRDFLANNLPVIEPDLRLFQAGERSSLEYPIADGRIDILAVDKDDHPVVIELKVSRGRNKTLGQLLYYMAWADANLNKGRSRGIVVAREISDELAIAAKRVPGLLLFRYKLNFTLEPVRLE